MRLNAVIFDLDGVITDTAEYHYLGWQRLADEEGLIFNRKINEGLRGLSRLASLMVILDVNLRKVSQGDIEEWMDRKNRYYTESLEKITPDDLLPGAMNLIQEMKAAGIKVAIGSASKNAATVIQRLGIRSLIDIVSDGYSTERSKPAPDLFLHTAAALEVNPAFCAVFEDAEAGIEAALSAGMWAIGLGPQSRVAQAHVRYDDLSGVYLSSVLQDLESAEWFVVEPSFDSQTQHHKETIFTSGNGYFCTRGSLEESYPEDMPASFVHCLWDDTPVFFTELANIPRWAGVDIWINQERFRLDRGQTSSYRRWLDLRTGVLRREIRWQAAPEGPVAEIFFERFGTITAAHSAALRCQVRIVSGEGTVRIRSGIDDHVENTGRLHWDCLDQGSSEGEVWLSLITRDTRIKLAIAAAHRIDGPDDAGKTTYDADGQPTVDCQATLKAGESLAIEKFVGIITSNEAVNPVQDAIQIARNGAEQGYSSLYQSNEAAWSEIWDVMDIEVEGDLEAQHALRFSIFQLIIAAPRFTDRTSIGSKTLSGFGYRHHVFWDTELFMLPLFTYTQPTLSRNMLMYRYYTLPGAREKARRNNFEGAQFAWESAADGSEVTPVWVVDPLDPTHLVRIWTGDIEIHITADIAYAIVKYWHVTGDDPWMREYGAEIVLDGARFWASAAKLEKDGKYHLRNVIGPDEYHDGVDDNAFTNYMAKWHIETAFEILAWLRDQYPDQYKELSQRLDLDDTHLAHWADVRDRMYMSIDPKTGLIEQFDGYFNHIPPDFQALRSPNRVQSMQALLGIDGCNETQVLKQPDVLMLQYLLPDDFPPEQIYNNYQYYNPRTDLEHGSSLGLSISTIMATRVGEIEFAYQHFMRAARADLRDVRHNAGDGIHGASAGGLWQAAVFGFGGLQLHGDRWSIQPRLPAHWVSMSFKFYHRGQLQKVNIPA